MKTMNFNPISNTPNIDPVKEVLWAMQGKNIFKDGEYYGEILSRTDKKVRFVCKNGNKYQNGRITTLKLDKQ